MPTDRDQLLYIHLFEQFQSTLRDSILSMDEDARLRLFNRCMDGRLATLDRDAQQLIGWAAAVTIYTTCTIHEERHE